MQMVQKGLGPLPAIADKELQKYVSDDSQVQQDGFLQKDAVGSL